MKRNFLYENTGIFHEKFPDLSLPWPTLGLVVECAFTSEQFFFLTKHIVLVSFYGGFNKGKY